MLTNRVSDFLVIKNIQYVGACVKCYFIYVFF